MNSSRTFDCAAVGCARRTHCRTSAALRLASALCAGAATGVGGPPGSIPLQAEDVSGGAAGALCLEDRFLQEAAAATAEAMASPGSGEGEQLPGPAAALLLPIESQQASAPQAAMPSLRTQPQAAAPAVGAAEAADEEPRAFNIAAPRCWTVLTKVSSNHAVSVITLAADTPLILANSKSGNCVEE